MQAGLKSNIEKITYNRIKLDIYYSAIEAKG